MPHPTPNIPEMDEAKFVHNATIVNNADAVHHANNIQKAENVSDVCNVANAERVDNSVNTTVLGSYYKGVYSCSVLNTKASAGDIKDNDFYKLLDGGTLSLGSIVVTANDIVVMKNGVWQFFYRNSDYVDDNISSTGTKAVQGKVIKTALDAKADATTLDSLMRNLGEKSVVQINAITPDKGDTCIVTGEGNITLGNLDVEFKDIVYFNGTVWTLFANHRDYVISFESPDYAKMSKAVGLGHAVYVKKKQISTATTGDIFYCSLVTQGQNNIFITTILEVVNGFLQINEYRLGSSDTSFTLHSTKSSQKIIPECPIATDGTFVYKCTVSSGVASYSWVAES